MDEMSFASGRDRCAAWHFNAESDAFAGPRGVPCVVVMAPGVAGTRDTIRRAAGRNRAVAPIAPEAHLMYVLTRIAPPLARWFTARTSAVLAK